MRDFDVDIVRPDGTFALHNPFWLLSGSTLDGTREVFLADLATVPLLIIAKQAKSHTWMPNDGIDFVHAVVAVAYSDFVLLDRQWTERVRALPLPANHTRPYYRYEMDQFLTAFEECVIVPSSVGGGNSGPGVV